LRKSSVILARPRSVTSIVAFSTRGFLPCNAAVRYNSARHTGRHAAVRHVQSPSMHGWQSIRTDRGTVEGQLAQHAYSHSHFDVWLLQR
jgi:hypothetical protein